MHRDIYAEVTARIVAALEAGIAPWVRPWTSNFEPVPVNAASGRAYRGINTVLLTLQARLRGYARNAWLTYLQAGELGAHVRAGESGTTVVFYRLFELPRPTTVEQIEDDGRSKVVPLLRSFTVFNVGQVDCLPACWQEPEALVAWDPHEAAEAVLAGSGAVIRHGGVEAYYSPRADLIQLPERHSFPDPGGYYATALHELVHWTAHPARLHRDLSGRFGDAGYAAEELIAEMGSAFVCASCRIEGRMRHADYIGSWLNLLKGDKRAVFAAAAKAQAAVDFIESECGRPPVAATSSTATVPARSNA